MIAPRPCQSDARLGNGPQLVQELSDLLMRGHQASAAETEFETASRQLLPALESAALTQRENDIACSVQTRFEEVVLAYERLELE